MIEAKSVFNRIYSGHNPNDYCMYDLQKDWAMDAINYYILFNNLSLIDIEKITRPYVFTTKKHYGEFYFILDLLPSNYFTRKDFEISPDCNGGLTAVYIGSKDAIITIDFRVDTTLELEIMSRIY